MTPVAIINRILTNIFKKTGITDKNRVRGLLYTLEIFLPNQKDKNTLQEIHDYYKAANLPYSPEKLFKIIAHFYNQFPLLLFADNYIPKTPKIPKTEECYLLPTLEYCGSQPTYNSEGTLIKTLTKMLSIFDWIALLETRDINKFDPKLSEVDIANDKMKNLYKKIEFLKNIIRSDGSVTDTFDKTEFLQIAYAIYAMFDYLPLPVSSVPMKSLKDNTTSRYSGEPQTRLFDLAANHLYFIFHAYPGLGGKNYKSLIINQFLRFVAFGVSKDELKVMLESSKNEPDVRKLLTNDAALIIYTNEPDGLARGFAQQYYNDKSKYEVFYLDMQNHVEAVLEKMSPPQEDEILASSSDTSLSSNSPESQEMKRLSHNISAMRVQVLSE